MEQPLNKNNVLVTIRKIQKNIDSILARAQ